MDNSNFSLVYSQRLNLLVFLFNQYANLGYQVTLGTSGCKLYLTELCIFCLSTKDAKRVFALLNSSYGSTFFVKVDYRDSYGVISICCEKI